MYHYSHNLVEEMFLNASFPSTRKFSPSYQTIIALIKLFENKKPEHFYNKKDVLYNAYQLIKSSKAKFRKEKETFKKNNFFWFIEKENSLNKIEKYINTTKFYIKNLVQIYSDLEKTGNLSTESQNEIFKTYVKNIKEEIKENKKDLINNVNEYINKNKEIKILNNIRYDLYKIVFHLSVDNQIKEKDYELLKKISLSNLGYFYKDKIERIKTIKNSIYYNFTKEIIYLLKYFYCANLVINTEKQIIFLQKGLQKAKKANNAIKPINAQIKQAYKKDLKKIEDEKDYKNEKKLKLLQEFYNWEYQKTTQTVLENIKKLIKVKKILKQNQTKSLLHKL